MNVKKELLKIWESEEYAKELELSSLPVQEVWSEIIKACRQKSILIEVGCGDAKKLIALCDFAQVDMGIGIDLSRSLLITAQQRTRKAKNISLVRADGCYLPFRNCVADAVVSLYAVEHFVNPQVVIEEMIRLEKNDGVFVVAAPNYGSPFFPSPCNKQNLLLRFLGIFKVAFVKSKELQWHLVNPRVTETWKSDFDCVVEPSLLLLEKYVKQRGIQTVISKPVWPSGNKENMKIIMRVCRRLIMFSNGVSKYFSPIFIYVGLK